MSLSVCVISEISSATFVPPSIMSESVASAARKYRNVFSAKEDTLLERAIQRVGTADWDQVSRDLPGRTARQCRERWVTYLSPSVNRGPWTSEEDGLLFDLIQTHGTKWGLLTGFFHGRTQNNIKNRWNTITRKARTLGISAEERKSFIEAGQVIACRSIRTHCPFEKEIPRPSPQELYSLENLLNSDVRMS
jgi:hypothetical protein